MRRFRLDQALERSPARPRPLTGDVTTDICIVAGGLTGLWDGPHIKEADPAAVIVIIERDIRGGGACGSSKTRP